MKVNWFVSDIHFGHANIIKYCDRPFDTVQEMDEKIIRKWQDTVSPNDIVWVVGDFSFHGPVKTSGILARLPGDKVLIRGNHDHKLSQTKGWMHVHDYYELKVPGFPLVVMCHYAFEVWKNSHHGTWHLHGHSHGTLPRRGLRYDVGIDNIGFDRGLLTLEEIGAEMRGSAWTPDHHGNR